MLPKAVTFLNSSVLKHATQFKLTKEGSTMIQAVPYLNFQDSLEALAFYEKLGATNILVTKMSDDMFSEMPAEEKRNPDFVMNAEFRLFGQRVFCSDSWGNQPVDHAGSNLCFTFDQADPTDVSKIESLFAKAEALGCQISMPLGKSEWTDLFGMFTDPFGISWLLSGE